VLIPLRKTPKWGRTTLLGSKGARKGSNMNAFDKNVGIYLKFICINWLFAAESGVLLKKRRICAGIFNKTFKKARLK
jgi:hypothetical protein